MKPGDRIDERYELLRSIGEGGMGEVFEALNTRIGKRVAIKVLQPHNQDEEMVQRFEQEARAAAKVGSSHIVDVLDLGDLPDGRNFIVMEYLEGESLADRLERVEKLDVMSVARIAIQLLDGLAKVHAQGIIHRDLKPANVHLAPSGEDDFVKILDFGVCKISGNTAAGMTRPGSMLGTPAYMAPEQVESTKSKIDGRADLYAVGVMMYRAISGTTPFQGATIHQMIAKVTDGEPQPLAELVPDLDADIAAMIMKAMQKNPDDRFADATEFRDAITTWLKKQRRVDRLLAEFLDVDAHEPEPVASPSPPPPPPPPSSRRQPRSDPSLRPDTKRMDLVVAENEGEDDTERNRNARNDEATIDEPRVNSRHHWPKVPQLAQLPRPLLYAMAGGFSLLVIGIVVALAGGDDQPPNARVRHEPTVSVESLDGALRGKSPPVPSASASATVKRRPPHR